MKRAARAAAPHWLGADRTSALNLKEEEQEWVTVTVLPNFDLDIAIEGGAAAIAPQDDPRVVSLCTAYPHLGAFLGRFTDAFGVKLRPPVLLARKNSFALDLEALAGFRDTVALAVIPYSRAAEIVRPRGLRTTYADAFRLFPWTFNNGYHDLVAFTPALSGVHEVRQCGGQSAPELSPQKLIASEIDRPLLGALAKRWRRRFGAARPRREDRALFRSLNMASHAALMPSGNETTYYDLGRSVALWVSAFEILAHPGKGKVGLHAVYDLLDKVVWEHKTIGHKRYFAYEAGRNRTRRRPLACWLYGEIYGARNDYLHGNPVTRRRLSLRGRNLFQYAAPLYRLALTGYLDLSWREPCPPFTDTERLGKHIAEHMTFASYQETFEHALLTARK